MAYQIDIDPEVNCVFVHHSGEISPSEINALLLDLFEQDIYQPGTNILRNFLDASFSDEFGYEYFKEQAPADFTTNIHKLGDCRVAWVLPSRHEFIKTHQMKLVQYFQVSRVVRKEFFDLQSAKFWLGIPEDYETVFPALYRPQYPGHER